MDFGESEHRPMCLISTSRNSANTDSIHQAKVIPTLETNKQLHKVLNKFIIHQASTNLFFDAEKLEIMTVSKFLVKVPALEPF